LPLSEAEKSSLGHLKDVMRPYIIYDRLHYGYDSLNPQEQKRLAALSKKIAAGVELSGPEEEELHRLKDCMNNPMPVDENHPGWNNLIPREKRRFKILQSKEDDEERLAPDEDAELERLKDIVKNGRPIDENHPGLQNLNPEQQQRFRELFKLKGDGKILTPVENDEKERLDDIILNGVPIDEDHPGFKGLDPYQKKRYKNLKNLFDERQLSPMQKKEFDQLRTQISPSYFSPNLAAALTFLVKKQKDGLNTEEEEQKLRLQHLKDTLPNIKEQEGLTPDEKLLLSRYLQMRLFEQPMTPAQEAELADLLQRDKDVERNLTHDEQKRMKYLVKMLYRGAELEPEEENELLYLHQKQNRGIGGLTPTQYNILKQLKEYSETGQPVNDKVRQSIVLLQALQNQPSQLSSPLEAELVDM